jgi:predicted HNH restriction endonuclease
MPRRNASNQTKFRSRVHRHLKYLVVNKYLKRTHTGRFRLVSAEVFSLRRKIKTGTQASAIDKAILQFGRAFTFEALWTALAKPRASRGTRKPKRTPEIEKAGYAEAKRTRREAYFFRRNQALVAAAKQHYGYVCQVCRFNFLEQYGERGKDYIECHHLDPLADRPERFWTKEIRTKIERVRVLCANCHRIVHRGKKVLDVDKLKATIHWPTLYSS